MMKILAVIAFALSLVACSSTGERPISVESGSSDGGQSGVSPIAQPGDLPTAAPDESWVWGDRGCCQYRTNNGVMCYEGTTQQWCDASKPSAAITTWREDTKCQYVTVCAN